ncbi:MAG TPA: ATP-binding protein [Dongiaceae bacterium]|nr:ATP-binding protein [Dongiaceae bacterium]
MSGTRTSRWREWLAFAGVAVVVALATLWLAGNWGRSRAVETLRLRADQSIALSTAVLRSELEKQRVVPVVLAQDPDVKEVLQSHDPTAMVAMNEKLEGLNAATRSAVIYLLDSTATTIASSNWREPTSFVGSNYEFRPYYTRAVAQGAAEHFALGTVSHRPGLYISRRIDDGGKLLGVIVVKVEFDQVEAEWAQSGGTVYVTDPDGVVLISSEPGWRFMTQRPLPPETIKTLRASQQFGDAALSPLPLRDIDRDIDPRAENGEAAPENAFVTTGRGVSYLRTEREISSTPWQLHLLLPAQMALELGSHAARAAALGGLTPVIALAALLLYRRQRAIARAAAGVEARLTLERRVEERTQDLRSSNALLLGEIEERKKVEAKLQVARDELAQANRLAMLGQITAGLAHEVNQPVAAIRSYADNAAAFLDRQEPGTARQNLVAIAGLTERIGSIIEELRGYARKATGEIGPMPLLEAIDGAVLLVGIRARRQGAQLVVARPDPAVLVIANRVRLEQVLVNLLQNALEAMESHDEQSLDIGVTVNAEEIRLTVTDSGPGIAAEVMAALFTPFVTTKPRGLGLGLIIAKGIVDDFGGALDVRSEPGRGTEFTLVLRRAS